MSSDSSIELVDVQPLTATIVAAVVLGETLKIQDAIGALLIVCGLGLISYQRYKDQRQLEEQKQEAQSPTPSEQSDSSTASKTTTPSETVSIGDADEEVPLDDETIGR